MSHTASWSSCARVRFSTEVRSAKGEHRGVCDTGVTDADEVSGLVRPRCCAGPQAQEHWGSPPDTRYPGQSAYGPPALKRVGQ